MQGLFMNEFPSISLLLVARWLLEISHWETRLYSNQLPGCSKCFILHLIPQELLYSANKFVRVLILLTISTKYKKEVPDANHSHNYQCCHLFTGWGRDYAYVTTCVGGQRIACMNQLFLSIMWVLGMEFGSSDLEVSAFTAEPFYCSHPSMLKSSKANPLFDWYTSLKRSTLSERQCH